MDNWVSIVAGASKYGNGLDLASTEIPEVFELKGNYPNPFNPVTLIQYALPASSPVSLVVYDMLGREVKVLFEGIQSAGNHEVSFDASHLVSGTYLYRLTTPNGTFSRTMSILK